MLTINMELLILIFCTLTFQVIASNSRLKRLLVRNRKKINDLDERMILLETGNYKLRCPAGYIKNERDCYRVVLERKNWTDALDTCQRESANLIRIEGRKEQHFISRMLRKTYYNEILDGFYTAAFFENDTEKWKWNPTSATVEYAPWCKDPRQPSTPKSPKIPKDYLEPWNEGTLRKLTRPPVCIQLWAKCPRRFDWDDILCGWEKPFICEINL